MSKIPVNDLIALFRRMYNEHWSYVWGAACEGCVDCSGAFVWAYEQFRKSIAHGSNAIARQYVRELLPISQAKPGMAAFKYREPGQQNYDLPAKYRNSADQRDYYHIGLVDEGGKFVLNAQGTKAGFTRTKISNWGCVGYLTAVDYGGDKQMGSYIVTAPDGNPVRLREMPNKGADIICKLKCGTVVNAAQPENGWQEVRYGDSVGYMMQQFLKPYTAPETGDHLTLTMEQYNQLCQARDILISIVGVG